MSDIIFLEGDLFLIARSYSQKLSIVSSCRNLKFYYFRDCVPEYKREILNRLCLKSVEFENFQLAFMAKKKISLVLYSPLKIPREFKNGWPICLWSTVF